MKKTLIVIGLAFLIFFVAKHPDAAAHAVKSLASGLTTVANGFGNFFAKVTS